jgi:hypothetical protein
LGLVGEKLQDEEGNAIGGDAAQYCARILVEANDPNNAIKLFELGRKLHLEGKAEVDTADFELIEKTIKANKRYSNLVIAQILLAMKNGKETTK